MSSITSAFCSCSQSPWKRVSAQLPDERRREYVLDTRTGDLYRDEPASIVAGKCVAVFFGALWHALGTMAWYAVRLPYDIIQLDSAMLAKDIWKIVTPLFCTVAVMAACMYALYDPYEARKWEAQVEFKWQYDISHKKDFRHTIADNRAEWDDTAAVLKSLSESETLYLSYCFQILGNTKKVYGEVLDAPQVV
jgi:hypothetical protein